jgi:hypothetical protein
MVSLVVSFDISIEFSLGAWKGFVDANVARNGTISAVLVMFVTMRLSPSGNGLDAIWLTFRGEGHAQSVAHIGDGY